jgi:hypothetical protein
MAHHQASGNSLRNCYALTVIQENKTQVNWAIITQPSSFEVETATEKLKTYISQSTDQILVELMQAGGNILILRSTNLLILFGTRKNCQSSGRNKTLHLFIRAIKLS